MIKILLAGHHRILRAGLRRLLDREPGFQVLGEAEDETEAVRLAMKLRPDILLVEEGMQENRCQATILPISRLQTLETPLGEIVAWHRFFIAISVLIAEPQLSN